MVRNGILNGTKRYHIKWYETVYLMIRNGILYGTKNGIVNGTKRYIK